MRIILWEKRSTNVFEKMETISLKKINSSELEEHFWFLNKLIIWNSSWRSYQLWKGTEKIINSKCNNFIISTTIEIFEEKFCCQNWSLILLNSFLKFYFLMTFKEIIFWEPPVWFGPLIFFKIYIDKIAFYASKIYPYAWREAGCINYICYFIKFVEDTRYVSPTS